MNVRREPVLRAATHTLNTASLAEDGGVNGVSLPDSSSSLRAGLDVAILKNHGIATPLFRTCRKLELSFFRCS
jgi:hypothetical protein